MDEERMRVFLHSLEEDVPSWLSEVRRRAREEGIPIIRPEAESLLRFLIRTGRPSSILEVGTGVGYSALFMSEYMPRACRITTIEKYEKRIPEARRNFLASGRSERITLLEGDAAQLLPALEPSFDFVFMDAAKGQYVHFLPEVLRLLCPGGLLVSDNVLQGGDILESRYAVRRRDRTIHARMREYLYALKHDPRMETLILPVGDGIAVSVRRRDAVTGEEAAVRRQEGMEHG